MKNAARHRRPYWPSATLIENWVIWRDARMWDRVRTLWHKDGRMWATWFQGTCEEFIKVSQQGFDRGVRIMHMLGGTRSTSRASAPSRRPR